MKKPCWNREKTNYMLFTCLLLILSFGFLETCNSATSTIPVVQWTTTFGGSSEERADSVIQTKDGGYAFSGLSSSVLYNPYVVPNWYMSQTLFFGKVDMYGKMQFNRTLNISEKIGNFTKTFLVQTKDNGYAIAFRGVPGYGDVFSLIVLDANGNTVLTKKYPGTEFLDSFILTSDGGYAMAGRYRAIKIDALGNIQWSKNASSLGLNYLNSIVQTNDGGYAIAGATVSSLYRYNFSLVKTDSSGTPQWNRSYTSPPVPLPFYNEFLVQTKDGGYAIAGSITVEKVNPSRPCGYWLAKTDSNGILKWNQSFLNQWVDKWPLHSYPTGFVQDSDGGFALAGSNAELNSNCWVMRTDSSGVVQGNKTFGTVNDWVLSMSRTTDGGYILAGATTSNIYGNMDIMLVKTPPLVPVLDHFDFDWIGYQSSGKPFSITVKAKNQYGDVFSSYSGNNSLASSNGTVKPTTIGPFVGGVWTGSVTFNTAIVTNSITNEYLYLLTLGGGKLAQSNPVAVVLTVSYPTLPSPTKGLPRGDQIDQSPTISAAPSGLESMALFLVIAVAVSVFAVILASIVYSRKKAKKDSQK